MIVCANCLNEIDKADFEIESPHEQERKFTPFARVATLCCNHGEAIRIEKGYDVADLLEQEMSRHNEDIFQEIDYITIKEYQERYVD